MECAFRARGSRFEPLEFNDSTLNLQLVVLLEFRIPLNTFLSRMAPAVASAALLLACIRMNVVLAWNDTFDAFDSGIWTQQTDIEHCSDGACFEARVDHLSYGPSGLVMAMDMLPCNKTGGCCEGGKCAQWASGHIATADNYLYGTYEIMLQPAHAANNGIPPTNAFSCWTPTYVGKPVHNEIAVCFSGLKSANTEIHFSYWYDATAHTTVKQLPFQWGTSAHLYKVVWSPTSIQYYVDGSMLHEDTGDAGKTIPYTPGYSALILRPKNNNYISDVFYRAAWMSYDTAYLEFDTALHPDVVWQPSFIKCRPGAPQAITVQSTPLHATELSGSSTVQSTRFSRNTVRLELPVDIKFKFFKAEVPVEFKLART